MSAAAPHRSWLFVPGDDARKIDKALSSQADALILDLEDAVAPARKAAARALVAERLAAPIADGPARWVRINPLDGADGLRDLAAIIAARPDGIVLPKAEGPDAVRRLGHGLDALEAREGLAPGSIQIIAIATETPRAALALPAFADAALPRLAGLTWGAEDLSAALGAADSIDAAGALARTFEIARSLCLLAARACDVAPIEGVFTDYRDAAGLVRASAAAAREGFTGRLAIHPDQIAPINAAFTPDDDALARAERIIAAFAAAPEAGTIGLDGRMLDRPHLVQAQRLLARRRTTS